MVSQTILYREESLLPKPRPFSLSGSQSCVISTNLSQIGNQKGFHFYQVRSVCTIQLTYYFGGRKRKKERVTRKRDVIGHVLRARKMVQVEDVRSEYVFSMRSIGFYDLRSFPHTPYIVGTTKSVYFHQDANERSE